MKIIADIKGANIDGDELWFLNQVAKMINFMSEEEIDTFKIGNVNSTLLKKISKEILHENSRLSNLIEIDNYEEAPEEEWINHESSSVFSESTDGSDTMDGPA